MTYQPATDGTEPEFSDEETDRILGHSDPTFSILVTKYEGPSRKLEGMTWAMDETVSIKMFRAKKPLWCRMLVKAFNVFVVLVAVALYALLFVVLPFAEELEGLYRHLFG